MTKPRTSAVEGEDVASGRAAVTAAPPPPTTATAVSPAISGCAYAKLSRGPITGIENFIWVFFCVILALPLAVAVCVEEWWVPGWGGTKASSREAWSPSCAPRVRSVFMARDASDR